MTDPKNNSPFPEPKVEAEVEAKKKKEERLRKEAEKKAQQPPAKFYYDVKIEAMIPATLTWRVQAENPQQAAELIKGKVPQSVKHRLIGRRDLKVTVYDFGSTFIKWVRHLAG